MTKRMWAPNYDFGGVELQNIKDGQSSNSAASVQQLNAAVSASTSNLQFKGSVRVASTGNVSVATAPATIDGVALNPGDRVLLKNQTTASQNGIYIFTAANSALTRSADASTNAEVAAGLWVIADEGTVNAGTAWLLTTPNPITLGTTNLTFVRYPPASFGYVAKTSFTGPPTTGTTWVLTHNLGTQDVVVSVRDATTNQMLDVDIVATDVNTVTLTAGVTLTQNGFKAVVVG